MSILITLTTTAFFYQLYLTYNGRRMLKNSHTLVNTFTHHSFLKKTLIVILLLALSFTMWGYANFGPVALTNIPIIGYALLMIYNHSQKIIVTDSGIYMNGRFFLWEIIDKVEVFNQDSIRLHLNGGRYKIYVADKVDEIVKLQQLAIRGIKRSRDKR
jgi:hypothetical protein